MKQVPTASQALEWSVGARTTVHPFHGPVGPRIVRHPFGPIGPRYLDILDIVARCSEVVVRSYDVLSNDAADVRFVGSFWKDVLPL